MSGIPPCCRADGACPGFPPAAGPPAQVRASPLLPGRRLKSGRQASPMVVPGFPDVRSASGACPSASEPVYTDCTVMLRGEAFPPGDCGLGKPGRRSGIKVPLSCRPPSSASGPPVVFFRLLPSRRLLPPSCPAPSGPIITGRRCRSRRNRGIGGAMPCRSVFHEAGAVP
jgi:hypothetical protein